MPIERTLIGDTVKFIWVHSGSNPTSIYTSIYDGDETLVHSDSMVSSGNGFFYYRYIAPNTVGFYVAETTSWVESYPYKRRIPFQVIDGSID